jgi:hypothetical protein
MIRRAMTQAVISSHTNESRLSHTVGAEGELVAADVRNERIDVFAQYSLLRMSKDPAATADANDMLAAVRSGELGGIYKEDQKVPALRAVKMGTWWGTIIPKGEDGALFLDPTDPAGGTPLIIFRDKVRSDKPRIDAALRKAWVAFKALRDAKSGPGDVTLNRCPAGSPTVTAGQVEVGQVTLRLANIVPPLCAQVRSPQPALTAREVELIDLSLARGQIGIEPLTGDPERNANTVANSIFCGRVLSSLILGNSEDPLLCIDGDVTLRHPGARQIRASVVRERGPIVHFPALPRNERLFQAVDLLVNTHGYPVNAAAGIVGNFFAESGVLPSMVEGGQRETSTTRAQPLRAPNFANRLTDFTAQEVMNRNRATRSGPRDPGVGLAQWTEARRRAGLFRHTHRGRALGAPSSSVWRHKLTMPTRSFEAISRRWVGACAPGA